MEATSNLDGGKKSVPDSTSSQRARPDTFFVCRMLTPSEIESLRLRGDWIDSQVEKAMGLSVSNPSLYGVDR